MMRMMPDDADADADEEDYDDSTMRVRERVRGREGAIERRVPSRPLRFCKVEGSTRITTHKIIHFGV